MDDVVFAPSSTRVYVYRVVYFIGIGSMAAGAASHPPSPQPLTIECIASAIRKEISKNTTN